MGGKPVIILSLFLWSCGDVAITGKPAVKADEVGYFKSKQLEGTEYQVEYLPAYQDTKSFAYFRFHIISKALENDKERLQYMNYRMQQDFLLRLHGDSILSVFYQPIPKGFGDKQEFLVAFETGISALQPGEVMEFIFNDHLVRNEPIVFPYTSKDFAKNDNKQAE